MVGEAAVNPDFFNRRAPGCRFLIGSLAKGRPSGHLVLHASLWRRRRGGRWGGGGEWRAARTRAASAWRGPRFTTLVRQRRCFATLRPEPRAAVARAGALCGMAMAEGERTECAEPPRDEPPADGALKRAEELKTEANDYFKGEPGQAGAPRLQNGPGGAGGSGGALAKPWQRGAPEPRRGVAPGGKSRGLATEVPGLGDPCSQGQSMQHPWSLGVHPPLGLST